ncbi:DUF692 domain-containing protein [Kordiimonas marina]|uniref:MNIO family bufferin maturase n=1 Tax=Kordiimonas marina TaxID=2872312 RepID=UPI001FF4CE9C|nr:DUF692 domain-containing protein [Kordiimonas marina]MCJ9430353.1 DUF692 domain-containing protein [Kordiimonas marina]
MTSPLPLSPSGSRTPVGVGLKSQHYQDVLQTSPALTFFEVHAENYMVPGGAHRRYLDAISDKYALSLHGVGMSLGSAEGLDEAHVRRFRALVEDYRPWLISEHLAWSRRGDTYLNDLLPLPLNAESLEIVTRNVSHLQDAIGRRVLVENPSAYLSFETTDIPEVEFLSALADRTGCGLLLDVNNVFVSATNMGWDAAAYLDAVPTAAVGEIHLAGHALKDIDGVPLRIDDHGSRVAEDVWELYRHTIARLGARPTLIEWDTNVPSLATLVSEAGIAEGIMRQEAVAREVDRV